MAKKVYDIIKKRKHVVHYDMNQIPPKDVIYKHLKLAWSMTPSKQNCFPYKIHILGPDFKEQKKKLWDLVVSNHFTMEEKGVEVGMIEAVSGRPNPYYYHIRHNPYTLIITPRLVLKQNAHYTEQIRDGHYMEQMDPVRMAGRKDIDAISIEVGMFVANLCATLMEQGLDISYTNCFPRDVKHWKKDFGFIEYAPVLLVSIGKAEHYRGFVKGDTKAPFEDIIEWR